jgi:hypothetical protein
MDEPTGKAKGGNARAKALAPERRSEIARQGAEAKRALAALPKATHGAADHPLSIGGIEIPCYVLEDERRVLSLRGLTGGIGLSTGGDPTGSGEARIVSFLRGLEQKGLDVKELMARLKNPIQFQPPGGGRSAYGYEATILADICDAVLAARKEGMLTPGQARIADKCEILVRGFARVGIVALVDEVTGFQRDRDRNNRAKILEAFVAKEIQPYVKTFPSEYYEELFRLYNLPYPPAGNKSWRPQFFGMITNEVVYARLAPNLIPELKKTVSKAEKKAKLHSALTQDIGHPRLREHLASIVAIQKLSKTPKEFIANVDRVHVKYGQNLPLFDVTGDAAKGATASLPPPSSEPEQPA